jgi:hypothetical protein
MELSTEANLLNMAHFSSCAAFIIPSYEAEFHNPTILKTHSSICTNTAHATMAGLFFCQYYGYMIDTNDWAMLMVY